MEHIRMLFEHLWWADERVLSWMAGRAEPPARSVELLAHVLGAELIWLDRIEGVPQSVEVWPDADLAGCRELCESSRRRWQALLRRLDIGDQGRSVVYRNSAGRQFTSTFEEILLHVALHGAYHRGQIAMGLRDAGLEPAPTDFIAFVRGAPAATRENARARADSGASEDGRP